MTPQLDWTERGRELGATLDGHHALVVVGSDPMATSEVALGIARLQAVHRRVAVTDLFGEAPPLQSLVVTDDPHGIVDSFQFGVSLNKVAYPVADAGELYIIPSGSTPIDYEDICANPRWRRLAAGFREVGALLVVVAPADAAQLADLVYSTDGAIIVGDVVPADIPVAQTIAWLRPRRSGPTSIAGAAPLAVVEAAREKPRSRRTFAGIAGVAITLAAVAMAAWFAYRPFASERPVRVGARPEASPLAGTLAIDRTAQRARADSVRRDSLARVGDSTAAADSFPLLSASNAVDSARASAWAVQLERTNTKSGAIMDLRIRFETVPAGTYGQVYPSREFLLVAGAYPSRAGAESLLVQLRNHKTLGAGLGVVSSMPFAFLVQADVPSADVPARLARFAARGQPVYALRQASGAVNLYFGAYESTQQAALAVPTVREAGVTPSLVYRIGRVF
ncbi:MAG: hypothetical protein ABJA80_00750 [bacterium]